MNGERFALPFGRCLRPNPDPKPPRLETGSRIRWLPDGEEGILAAVSSESIALQRDESEACVYNRMTMAVRERIAVLAPEEDDA